MRKTVSFLALVLALGVLFSACGKKANAGDLVVKAPYKVSKYLTLGNYKDLSVMVTTSPEVTEEAFRAAIEAKLYEKSTGTKEVTDRGVKNWDTVNIDYEGLLDGVAFDGGTAAGQDLTIGSNSLIPGFESGLIGAVIGQTVALNLTFPEPYRNNPDLAGQPVVFNVKINKITENILPEYTDDFVNANFGYDTVEQFEKGYLEQLKQEKLDVIEAEKKELVWAQVIDNCTLKSYPQDTYDKKYNEMYTIQERIASNNGVTLDALLQYYNMTLDQFEAKLKAQVEDDLLNEMAAYGVLTDAGLNISAEEQARYKADLLKSNGFSTEEEFTASYGNSFETLYGAEELKTYYIITKAYEYCAQSARAAE